MTGCLWISWYPRLGFRRCIRLKITINYKHLESEAITQIPMRIQNEMVGLLVTFIDSLMADEILLTCLAFVNSLSQPALMIMVRAGADLCLSIITRLCWLLPRCRSIAYKQTAGEVGHYTSTELFIAQVIRRGSDTSKTLYLYSTLQLNSKL